MSRIRPVMLLGALLLLTGLPAAQDRPVPPDVRQARERRESLQKGTAQDQIQPQQEPLQPDLEKARMNAGRLLALAQKIHTQLQTDSNQLPASLAADLKEMQKLTKRIRSDLLL